MAGITQEKLASRVKRNFIPEGEETPSELAERARRQQRGLRQGSAPNFIPDPTVEPVVFLGAEAEHQLAVESSGRRAANAKGIRWEEAKRAMLRLSVPGAIQTIGDLTKAQQELFLLAEEATQGRSEVLGRFGKVGENARAIWFDVMYVVPVEEVNPSEGREDATPPISDSAGAGDVPPVESTPKESPRPRKARGAQAEAQAVFDADELAVAFAKASGGDSVPEEDVASEPVAEDAQAEEQ